MSGSRGTGQKPPSCRARDAASDSGGFRKVFFSWFFCTWLQAVVFHSRNLMTSLFPKYILLSYVPVSLHKLFQHLFSLSFTWCLLSTLQVSAQTLLPLDPKPGQQPLLCSHNALCFSCHSPCLLPLPKGSPAPLQGSDTKAGSRSGHQTLPSSHTQRP